MKKPFTNLSERTDHHFSGKAYSVVSLPHGMEIIDDRLVVHENIPAIAVLDFFTAVALKLFPGVKMCHGEFVARYASKGLEDKIGVLALDLKPNPGVSLDTAMIQAFSDLVELQKTYHNIIAVNISVGRSKSFDDLFYPMIYGPDSKHAQSLSSDTVRAKKNALLAGIAKAGEKYRDTDCFTAYQLIQSINQMVAENTEVYIASGNMGDEGIEMVSLSDAQYVVSGYDYSRSCKALHTAQERACYYFRKRFDENNKLICVMDGNIEFAPEEFPQKARTKRWIDQIFEGKEIKGTSFASPVKLNKFMHEYMSLAVRFDPQEKIRIEVDWTWGKIRVLDKPGGNFAEHLFAPYSGRTDVTVFGYDQTGEWAYIAFKSEDDMMVQGYARKAELRLE
ncbi:MAG: hypothetical protein IJD86_14145 [Clostridia bacterium]|nr:hypothetical protein [Clostridia bacterium]